MSRLRLGIPAAVAAVVLVASVCSDQQTGPTEADRPLAAAGEEELKKYCDALFPDPGTKNKRQGERSACHSKVESFIKQCVTKSNPAGCEEQFADLTQFTQEVFDDLIEPPYNPELPLFPAEDGTSDFDGQTTADAVNEFFEWLGASTDGQLAAGVLGPEGGTFSFVVDCGEGDSGGHVEAEEGELDETTLFTAECQDGVAPQAADADGNIDAIATVNDVMDQTFIGRVVRNDAYEITANPDFGDFGEPVGGLSIAQEIADNQLEICLFHSEAVLEEGDGDFFVLQELVNPNTGELETTFDNQGDPTCEPEPVLLGRGLRLASPGEVSGTFSKLRTPHWIVAEQAAVEVTLEINEGTDPVTLSDGSSGGMVVTVTPAPDNEDVPEVEISAIGVTTSDIVAGPFTLDDGEFSGTIDCDASGEGAGGDLVLEVDTYLVTAEFLGTEEVPAGFSNTVEVTCEEAA